MHTLDQLKSGSLFGINRLQLAEGLSEFPLEILELSESLEVLDLSNNNISALPDDFGRLKQLKILFMANNKFDHLPEVLSQCPNLEMIGFKSNQIKTVSEQSLPEQTRWLILTNNQIKVLPDSMGKLHRLQKLALAGNQITRLPDSMANCKNLELARISANQLTSLPDWLFQLPKLSWLAFQGNPLQASNEHNSDISDSVTQVGLQDLALKEQLGEGASGVIYRAEWINQPESLKDTSAFVAVKLFKGEVTSDGYPEDELKCCLSAGEHNNLIKVVAQISDEGQLGLVMELIPDTYGNLGLPPSLVSCTRDTFKAGTQFELKDIVRIVLQMSDAMAHLHSQSVSHGDVYAHNTMVDSNASMLFGDFGAASDLSVLSVLQKEAMESIEIRALGCLLDDLLKLSYSEHGEQAVAFKTVLSELRDDCMQPSMGDRPRFSEVYKMLDNLVVVPEEAITQ